MAENNCVVCFKNFHIYSIGECDHPVCYECSARMRVLCCQNECPMCRHEMEVVVFTEKVRPFRRLNRTYSLYDKKYNIAFEHGGIRDVFESLLQYVCQQCYRTPIFDTFELLKEHMKRIHDLYCCDLCADNLKIFPGEMRYYTRQELNRHKKIGDVDNRSHRGHPLCEFCQVRYLDRDELYKHLRKDHFFCHICDGEGIQQFYGTYLLLRDHYREKHYLCEEGTCIDETMTSVFPTEIDLKAHLTLVHYKNSRNKLAVRQARTLDLEFPLPPRSHDRRVRYGHDDTEDFSGGQQFDHLRGAEVDIMASLEQDFPTLGNSSSYHAPRAKFARESNNRLTFNDQNFPALGSEANINSNITNSVDVRPSTSGSTTSTSTSVKVDNKKPKERKTKNAQNCKSAAPASSSLALTWVEKAKEKPQSEKTPVCAAPFDSLTKPPQMNRKNFPNLKKDATTCPEVTSSKTTKKCKKSPTSSEHDHQSPAARVNYSEAIVKNATVKDEKTDTKKKSAPHTSKPKNAKEERSLNLNRDNKTHSFLLNANRKKVKMKPEVLVPLNDLKRNHSSGNSLATQMAQLKLTNNSNEAAVNANAVIDKKVNNANEKVKDETKKKTKNLAHGVNADAVIDKKVNNANEKIKDETKVKINKNVDEKIRVETKETKSREKPSKSVPSKNTKIDFGKLREEANQKALSTTSNLKNGRETETERGKNHQNSLNILKHEDGLPSRTNKFPPGLEKRIAPPPPPGFERPAKSESSSLLDPGMLFQAPFVYQQPEEFVTRNSQLIEKVGNSLVRRNENALNEFKNKSLMFRNGEISASDYYVYCIQNIEADKFEDVFVDLVALLPDIFKQQELWAIHQTARPSEMRNSLPPVNYCSICFQILKLDDTIMHYSKHGVTNDALLLCSSLSNY